MTAKELLQKRVCSLSEIEAAETLQFLDALELAPVIDYDDVALEDEEISSEEEAGVQEAREEIARGETISFDKVKAKYGL